MNLSFPNLHLVPYSNVLILVVSGFSCILCEVTTFSSWIFFLFTPLLVLLIYQANKPLLIAL